MPEVSSAALGRIGVLMGGYSSEREISLRSGRAILEALKNSGCSVEGIDIASHEKHVIVELIKKSSINVAFIALHGKLGEDGAIQQILEELKIPYTGSGVEASRLAINKAVSQNIFKKNNIPVPEHVIISGSIKASEDDLVKCLGGLPVVVKPALEGSSIGITIVTDKAKLALALQEALKFGPDIIVERYVKGRELTVGILDDQALPVIEIKPQNPFFDFSAKYQAGTTQYLIPAPIAPELSRKVQEIALKAYQVLGCRHLSRVDVMIDAKDNPYVLEINTIPGFTSTSLLPKAAKISGIDFSQLCLRLVSLAYEK
ncbi:MAG: D-alanine--D-alanine ligase [Candidatus Omnitrophota bacterium]